MEDLKRAENASVDGQIKPRQTAINLSRRIEMRNTKDEAQARGSSLTVKQGKMYSPDSEKEEC